ncbi:MAG TPA: globin, partial [Micromonosporaceae bacterium]|nr:globin [Micromonosporaceae bacterium]
AVGDTVRIGPPVGAMTLAAAVDDRELLLIGGGTGTAPMRALLESIPVGDARPVTLLLAARGPAELYDLAAMSAAVELRPAVTLVVALEQPDGYAGSRALAGQALSGQAHDALGQLGDLSGHEVFLAGPPGMLRSCLAALAELGVPTERLHFDVLNE